MEEIKIGALVRKNLPQIFEHCTQVDPEELTMLAEEDYCKEVFKLKFIFLRTPAEIEMDDQHKKYWTDVFHVLDHDVRVTSQWHRPRHLGPFLRYLVDKGLTPVGIPPEVVDAELEALAAQKIVQKSPGGSRYRKTPIGDPQNLAVRHVLGCLQHEAFTEKDWIAVKKAFGYRCVYCGSGRQVVIDHAVPISIDSLGEHRLGNLVPACNTCNKNKSQTRYDDYLRNTPDLPDPEGRIALIQAHMARFQYTALTDTLSPDDADVVRQSLTGLRAQIADAATSAIAAINDSLQPGPSR